MPLIPRPVIYLTAALSGVAVGYSLPTGLPGTVAQTGAVLEVTSSPASSPASDPSLPEMDTALADEGATASAWTLRSEPAVFDDLTNVYLSVPSDQPLRCGPRRRASLMLRCLEDRTAIYIAHDCATPMMDPEGWDVDLRLDQAEVQSIDLPVDSHGEAFGHWTYREARTMMEDLLTARTLSVRFTDLTGVESQMSFPVAGLAEPLGMLSQACHWSATPPWEQIEAPTAPPSTDTPVADGPDAPTPPVDEPVIEAASLAPDAGADRQDIGDVSLTSGAMRSFVLSLETSQLHPAVIDDPAGAQADRATPPNAPDFPPGLTMGERRLLEHDRDIAGD